MFNTAQHSAGSAWSPYRFSDAGLKQILFIVLFASLCEIFEVVGPLEPAGTGLHLVRGRVSGSSVKQTAIPAEDSVRVTDNGSQDRHDPSKANYTSSQRSKLELYLLFRPA